jgi:GTP cyclohydrolase I
MNQMKFPNTSLDIADTQSGVDLRNLPIDRVGVKGIRFPVVIDGPDGLKHSVAQFALSVALPGDKKGTHMSRFISLLQDFKEAINASSMNSLATQMLPLLEAQAGSIEAEYTHFINKQAPISGIQSLMDYQVQWTANAYKNSTHQTQVDVNLRVVVPVMSLCPCSKEISEYGAHNQRSHITISALIDHQQSLKVEDLVSIAESEASSELWGLLKRADEKFVTEKSYDNPKFVEDLVRDVARRVEADSRILSFVVEAENFESIHNHSAYARVSGHRGATSKAGL